MDKRGGISKDKLASGLLRGAVVSGLAAGLAAASLGGVANGQRNVHRDQRLQLQPWRRRRLLLGLADQLAGFRGAAEAWFVLCGLCD